MNTLTKNRILEAGDEYRQNGEWKPIPPKDVGLQIMFTTYKEVRRPSEEPIIPKQGSQMVRQESAKLPIEGSIPSPASTHMASYLPTVVSKKAHQQCTPTPSNDCSGAPESATATTVTPIGAIIEKPALREAKLKSSLMKLIEQGAPPRLPKASPTTGKVTIPVGARQIMFSSPSPKCEWIGRNGTFTQIGMTFMRVGNLVRLVPQGKRGMARNAQIEFPVSEIPQIVDWLNKQKTKTP